MQTQHDTKGLPQREDRAARERQLADTWAKVQAELETGYNLSDFVRGVWIEPLRLVDADDTHLWVAAPGLAGWTQERHGETIENAVAAVAGKRFTVVLIDEADL